MARRVKCRSAERLVDILTELHLNGVVKRNSLMEKFSITERTVYRDLNALSTVIEHCGEGEYRLSSALQSTQTENLHHSLAKFLQADSYFPERGSDFWQYLDARLNEKHISIQNARPEHTLKADLRRHFPAIEKAIRQRNLCKLTYKGKDRELHPYRLINQHNIWYLQATDKGKLKSFSLSQIEWLDIKKETFIPDITVMALLESSQDPWISREGFDVKLHVKGRHAHYFKRRDLLPEQKMLQDDGNGVVVSCRAAHENQILPLILFWLPEIEILEPFWLRDALFRLLKGYLSSAEKSLLPAEAK